MSNSASSEAPVVTVAILTCDAGAYLDITIPAILSWCRSDYEVLVVDNASKDGTLELLSRFPQLRVIRNGDNSGYARGKNRLVDQARGRYVLLLDDDVLVSSASVVADCLAFCECHPDAAFVSVPLMETGRDRTPHYGLFFGQTKIDRSLQELRERSHFEVGGFVGGLTFFRKDVFEQLGGYETLYPCQDYDLCARAHLQGWRIYTITTAHAIHLGVERREDIERRLIWDEYELCGFLRTIVKNYTLAGALYWMPLASLWILWKAVRRFARTRNARVLAAYGRSVGHFFEDFGDTLKERSRVQSSRVVGWDRFRRIVYQQVGG